MLNYLFTSECVTDGHPDKICDQIADAILDEALKKDPYSHMAVECTIKDDLVFLYGEANTKAELDYVSIALGVIRDIGYEEDYKFVTRIGKQSSEINDAVNRDEVSAGDQGMMFGYACNDNEDYMPAPVWFAQKLAKRLAEYRKEDPRIRPDGKTQVTVDYRDGKPYRIDTIIVSTQHVKEMNQTELSEVIKKEVIGKTIEPKWLDENTKYYINPSGSFTVGGSFGDSGTTGRKIVVDTYGGMGRIGGGCFSSKDPSKVDRSAAYYARYVAKNIVAHGLCGECEIQVAYAIGMNKPVSISLRTDKSEEDNKKILNIINKNFDFSVSNIIKELDLRRPIYRKTANFGHFGNKEYPWEKIRQELRR
jgi:S-adenosylmethionine synthetase